MATARDIVVGAMKRLALLQVGEEPTSDEATDGLTAMNGIMHRWGPHYDLDYTHTTLALSDTFPLPDGLHDGFKAMLAVRLSDDFGSAAIVSPRLEMDALEGWRLIEAYYYKDVLSDMDTGIKWTPGQRRYGWAGS